MTIDLMKKVNVFQNVHQKFQLSNKVGEITDDLIELSLFNQYQVVDQIWFVVIFNVDLDLKEIRMVVKYVDVSNHVK